MWTCIDELTSQSEYFCPPTDKDIECDTCAKQVKYPFYSVKNGNNSIDLCSKCYGCIPIELSIQVSSRVMLHCYCFVCEKTIESTIPYRGKFTTSATVVYLCNKCSKHTDYNQFIKSSCEKVLVERGVVNRRSPVYLNLHSVERAVPAELAQQVTADRIEQWMSLLETIYILPRKFGSVKQWAIFTHPIHIRPALDLNTCVIYLLVDCCVDTQGRIAAMIIDNLCCARIYIVFGSVKEYLDYIRKWDMHKKTITTEQYFKLNTLVYKLLVERKYTKLIKKYIGFFIEQKHIT